MELRPELKSQWLDDRQLLKALYLNLVEGNKEAIESHISRHHDVNFTFSFVTSGDCDCGREFEFPEYMLVNDLTFTAFDMVADWIMIGHCGCSYIEYEHDSMRPIASVSPLHVACFFGHVDLVRLLIDHGADVNFSSTAGRVSPLQVAVMSRALEKSRIEQIVLFLIESGASLDSTNSFTGESTLHVALCQRSPCLIQLLLQHGCTLDQTDNEHATALYRAVVDYGESSVEREIIDILVKAGADVNIGPKHDPTPLVMAVRQDNLRVVTSLVSSSNCDIDKPGIVEEQLNALFYAIYQGSNDISLCLLNHGASVNSVDQTGNSALMTAVLTHNKFIAKELVDRGCDVNRMNNTLYAPIHHAAWDGDDQLVKMLMDVNAQHDTRTVDGNTPLSLACHGHVANAARLSTVRQLMSLHVNVNNMDKDQDTPLLYATFNGCIETCQLLISHGANPNASNRVGASALWNAVCSSSKDVVRYLLQLNVALDVKSLGINQHAQSENVTLIYDRHRTPLFVAFDICREPDIAVMLIIAGIDMNKEQWYWGRENDSPRNTEECEAQWNMLHRYASSPVSLRRICRDFLRRYLGLAITKIVPELCIPSVLEDYLLLKGQLEPHILKSCHSYIFN